MRGEGRICPAGLARLSRSRRVGQASLPECAALVSLILAECFSLAGLPEGLVRLTKLRTLNLDYCDAMVVVGNIRTDLITQAVNRVFRPRVSRDNTRPMVLVKIYS